MEFSSTSVLVFDIETLDLTSLTLILECSLDLHVDLQTMDAQVQLTTREPASLGIRQKER